MLAAMCLLTCACGRATYERRLEDTKDFAAYRKTLDENLADEWKGQGVRIRVPSQFERLGDPKQETAENGGNGSQENPPDPRQPDFLKVPLPGLVAAWKAEVEVSDQEFHVPAYLFVLSNYEMWKHEDQAEEALEFNKTTAPNAVVDALGVVLPSPEQWAREKYPRNEEYVPVKEFLAAAFKATVPMQVTVEVERGDGSDGGSDDADGNSGGDQPEQPKTRKQTVEVPVDCKMYLHDVKDIRVAIVVVVPEQVDPGERLSLESGRRNSRIALCLETLAVSGEKPSGGGQSRGGGDDGGGGPTF